MDEVLTRRAVEVNWRNLALGHHVSRFNGATFVRNPTLPDIYDANFVFGMTASDTAAIDQLLTRAAREYAHAPRLTFRADPFTPPAFEAQLVLQGYERSETILLLLDGPIRRAANRFEILPIEDEAGWKTYSELKRLDWREHAMKRNVNPDDAAIAHRLASSSRLKCPPLRYMLAYEDGRAVGHCSTWDGLDGVGQVEDLFVRNAYRGRGIGTALIHSCVASARARGAGPIVIVADLTNTAKDLYASLGWRPLATCRQYGKKTGCANP